MIDATAIIMTKNESINIVNCLNSIKGFAKRCVVIDCGSTDNTVELARGCGADIYYHEFEYYAKQFNWGIENTNITTEWIIRLDADEQFPKALCQEVERLIKNNQDNEMNGITMEANYYFLNRHMKHGVRNKRKMMMFKKEYGCIEDKRRDAHSIISSGYSMDIKNKFLHYDFKTLDNYIKRYNWYATREMQDYVDYINIGNKQVNTDDEILKQRKKKYGLYYKAPKYIRAWLWFIYNYIFRLGILDGVAGFLFCFFECYWYRMLVDAKIYEYGITGGEFEKLQALD